VSEDEVDAGNLFATYLEALGMRWKGRFNIGGRKVPVSDPATPPIKELLNC